MSTKPAQVPAAPGTESTVPSPQDDDGRMKEQDGENRLQSEGDFMNRERLAGNE
jgi:hypothetical protein